MLSGIGHTPMGRSWGALGSVTTLRVAALAVPTRIPAMAVSLQHFSQVHQLPIEILDVGDFFHNYHVSLRDAKILSLGQSVADAYLFDDQANRIHDMFAEDIQALSALYPHLNSDHIRRAFSLAETLHMGQKRDSGHYYISHPVTVLHLIVLGLKEIPPQPSHPVINRFIERLCICALLHDVIEDQKFEKAMISHFFGNDCGEIVDGLTKADAISREDRENMTLQKLLMAAGRYIEVLIIKLIDRQHNMQTLGYVDEEHQKRKSAETIAVYVPLAEKLGMWKVRDRLLNDAVLFGDPDVHHRLFDAIKATHERVGGAVDELAERIQELLSSNLMTADVQLIQRTPGSVRYEEMNKLGGVAFDKKWIPNLYELRIVIDSLDGSESNRSLQHILNVFQVLGRLEFMGIRASSREFNWIGDNQKENGYEAWHRPTPCEGQTVLVEIYDRHVEAMNTWGVLADPVRGSRWLKGFLSRTEMAARIDRQRLASALRVRINVYSAVDGTRFPLPVDSLALDFAYAIGRQTGDAALSAKVNLVEGSLGQILKDGDQVQIETGAPYPQIQFINKVQTEEAREALQDAIGKMPYDRRLAYGRKKLQESLDARGLYFTIQEMITTPLARTLLNKIGEFYPDAISTNWNDMLVAIATYGLDTDPIVDSYLSLLNETIRDPNTVKQLWTFTVLKRRDRPGLLEEIGRHSRFVGINIKESHTTVEEMTFVLQVINNAQRQHLVRALRRMDGIGAFTFTKGDFRNSQ